MDASQQDDLEKKYKEYLVVVDRKHVVSNLSSGGFGYGDGRFLFHDDFSLKYNGGDLPLLSEYHYFLEGCVSVRKSGIFEPIKQTRCLIRNEDFWRLVNHGGPFFFSHRPGDIEYPILGGFSRGSRGAFSDRCNGGLTFCLSVPPTFWNSVLEQACEFVPGGCLKIFLKTIRLSQLMAGAKPKKGFFKTQYPFKPYDLPEPIDLVYSINLYGSTSGDDTIFKYSMNV